MLFCHGPYGTTINRKDWPQDLSVRHLLIDYYEKWSWPEDFTVTIDGQKIPKEEYEKPLDLNVRRIEVHKPFYPTMGPKSQ